MAANTRDASASRKSRVRSTSIVANIVFINPERRKARALERWRIKLLEYKTSLSQEEREVFNKTLSFLTGNPEVEERLASCQIIPFHAGKNHQPQFARGV